MQMKIVIAIDSLKDSITSFEAGKAAEEGIRRVYGKDSADIVVKPLADADYLITGEGRLDHQTAMGKGPVGIAKMAKKYGVKVIGMAGSYTDGAQECNVQGIDAYFAIVPGAMDLKDAMDAGAAKKNMANTAEQVFRLIRAADCRF